MLDELTRTLDEIAGMIAERSGRPADDDSVLALAGAVIGVTIAAWFGTGGEDWLDRFMERFATGMTLLETGFSL